MKELKTLDSNSLIIKSKSSIFREPFHINKGISKINVSHIKFITNYFEYTFTSTVMLQYTFWSKYLIYQDAQNESK